MDKVIKWIKSVFSMKRGDYLFADHISGEAVFEYTDCFGVKWMAAKKFYPWGFRVKKITDNETYPCQFDHNGECLICDCWFEDCAYARYIKEDFKWEGKHELDDLFKWQLKDKFQKKRYD